MAWSAFCQRFYLPKWFSITRTAHLQKLTPKLSEVKCNFCLSLVYEWHIYGKQTYNNDTKQKYYRIMSKMFMGFILCIKYDIPTKCSTACFYFSISFYKPRWCCFAFWPFTISTLTLRCLHAQTIHTDFQVQWLPKGETKGNKECW